MENYKETLKPGDIVIMRHDELNFKPEMLIKEIVYENKKLIGIKCVWFDSTYSYNEAIFSTKDLIKV